MSNDTGTVNSAVPTIIAATGSVDKSEDGAMMAPIIPPAKTTIEEQESISDNPIVNTQTFFGRSRIGVYVGEYI
jgi:hypothetical protein